MACGVALSEKCPTILLEPNRGLCDIPKVVASVYPY